jgi:hypothetical protein
LSLSISPSVCGWNVVLNNNFIPIPKQMFVEAHRKLGVSIIDDKLWYPVMPNPHIEEQLSQVESCCDHFSWSHFCQLRELINYHEDGIHSIPLG